MASTRSKNTPGDYQLETRLNLEHSAYLAYEPYGHADTTYFPGDGLIGAKISNVQLSKNYCDIESELRGIGTTNLVNPQAPVTAQINTLKSMTFMKRVPLIIPAPIIVNNNERPIVLN
jgi:hypothetical protein